MIKKQEDLAFVKQVFSEDMNLCSCGNPEDGYKLVYDILEAAPFHEDWERVVTLIGNFGSHHIVLSVLDHARLIEHGGGIGGSWITPKGQRLLDILRQVTDWDQLDAQLDQVPYEPR